MITSLKWLARHQNPDGSWSVTGYTKQCRETCAPHPGHESYDTGVTGLSLLAFLGAGYSHLSRDTFEGICFGDVVRKGLKWMLDRQDPDGRIGSPGVEKGMYNHAIGTLALVEAYGLTGSRLFRDQAQRSVDFLIAAQNPGSGWRYEVRPDDNDSSVTGWAVMALKSAELSGLAFPESGYGGARAWFDKATDPESGRVGYTAPETGKVFIPGRNESFSHHETLTAIAVMSRLFMDGNRKDPVVRAGAERMLQDPPRWEENEIDFYYWYCASLALYQFDGPKGRIWKTWNEPMKNALVKNQNTKSTGCRRGSWEPVGRWCVEGGRVYATALNALTLEVYYRYPTVFGHSN